MGYSLETMGNATLLLRQDGRPVLATDPWLDGTCYFGSWALFKALTEEQKAAIRSAPFIWISHGHPDHLHLPSIETLPRSTRLLIPRHYRSDIEEHLRGLGFEVQVLEFRKWTEIAPGVRVLCMENSNQDAMLLIEAGPDLILNLNDSPLCGHRYFLRREVRKHRRSYLAMLCTNDADMRNFIDESGERIAPPPEKYKPGLVWWTSDVCRWLEIDAYLPSAFQHLYVREDSAWAGPYASVWQDLERWWSAPGVRLCQPFVTLDLDTGDITENHPSQVPAPERPPAGTGDDDWDERLSEEEWRKLEDWVRSMPLLVPHLDVLAFVVGGERRSFSISERQRSDPRLVEFHVPRRSLLDAIGGGYFDDLLIGNFMKTRCENVDLYPHVSPIIAKLAGTAGVRTKAELRRFRWHYFRLSPCACIVDWCRRNWRQGPRRWLLAGLDRVGLLRLGYRVRHRQRKGGNEYLS